MIFMTLVIDMLIIVFLTILFMHHHSTSEYYKFSEIFLKQIVALTILLFFTTIYINANPTVSRKETIESVILDNVKNTELALSESVEKWNGIVLDSIKNRCEPGSNIAWYLTDTLKKIDLLAIDKVCKSNPNISGYRIYDNEYVIPEGADFTVRKSIDGTVLYASKNTLLLTGYKYCVTFKWKEP